MDDVLNSLKQKLGEEFLEKKQNRVKKPRQQRTAPTTAQQRQADARKAEDAKRQLKAQVKQEIKSGFQGPRPVPLLKLVKDALDFLSKVPRQGRASTPPTLPQPPTTLIVICHRAN